MPCGPGLDPLALAAQNPRPMLRILPSATIPALLALSTAAAAQTSTGPLYINELLADNETGAEDEQGQTEDWIELYNAGDADVSLAGYTISDDPERPDKWPFPAEASVPARGYLVVWADEDQEDGPLHANFKLSKGGEAVALFGADGTQVDAVTFPAIEEDQAYARRTDGGAEFVTQAPTFGSSNADASSATAIAAYPDFRAWPTVVDLSGAQVSVTIPAGVTSVRLTDALGRLAHVTPVTAGMYDGDHVIALPASPAGLYHLTAVGAAGSRSVTLAVR